MVFKGLVVSKISLFLCVFCALVFLSNSPVKAKSAFTPEQIEEIKELIKTHLIANPEIIVTSIDNIKKMAMEEKNSKVKKILDENREELEKSKISPDFGDPNADVTVVEFFDYNCGYCKVMLKTLLKIIKNDRGVRLVFKELPSLGENSLFAAKAAIAADIQGKYMSFHKKMMDNRGRFSEKTIFSIAKKLKLDIDKMKKDMESAHVLNEIEANRALARKISVSGTPAFIIGENVIPGAVSEKEFLTFIKETREKKSK